MPTIGMRVTISKMRHVRKRNPDIIAAAYRQVNREVDVVTVRSDGNSDKEIVPLQESWADTASTTELKVLGA